MSLVIFLIYLSHGNARDFIQIIPILGLVFLFLAFLLFISMWFVLGNKYKQQFVIDDDGIYANGIDKRARKISGLTTIAGVPSKQPGVVGVGLLGMSRDQYFLPWSKIKKVVFRSDKHQIKLIQNFLIQIHLHCYNDNYKKVVQLINLKKTLE